MKRQAERCSKEHVELHVKRQSLLGERMIGDKDAPSFLDFIGTGAIIVLGFAAHWLGWW